MRTKPFEKLEVGKTYLNRAGRTVCVTDYDDEDTYPFYAEGSHEDTDWYLGDGREWSGSDSPKDLIAEVIPDDAIVPGSYTTRGGLYAVVVANDVPDKEYPVVGYVVTSTGHTDPAHWTEKGEWVKGKPGPRDLVVAEPTILTVRAAAEDLLNRYVELINSGDAGNWDPEQEVVVKNLRAALANEQP